MEAFSALLVLCAGNSPVTVEFPSQRPVKRSFDVFVDLRLNNGWVNNRDAGDLRRLRAHYDVIVMCTPRKIRSESELIVIPVSYSTVCLLCLRIPKRQGFFLLKPNKILLTLKKLSLSPMSRNFLWRDITDKALIKVLCWVARWNIEKIDWCDQTAPMSNQPRSPPHPTVSVGCNYLSPPLILTSSRRLFIYNPFLYT